MFIINVCACRDADSSRLGKQWNPTYNNKAVFLAKTALFIVGFAAEIFRLHRKITQKRQGFADNGTCPIDSTGGKIVGMEAKPRQRFIRNRIGKSFFLILLRVHGKVVILQK